MAYPEIGFDLRHNGRHVLQLARGSFDRRAEQIFGVRYGKDAIGVESSASGAEVRGFVGKPETRAKIRRATGFDRQPPMGAAQSHCPCGCTKGMAGFLPKGLAPSYCLCLSIDPARVDVNVHPSKREVSLCRMSG